MTATLEPVQIAQRVDQKAALMDKLGTQLAQIRHELEPVEEAHDQHVENFVCDLWDQHVNGKRWPGEDVRLALARKDMDPQLRGAYIRLKNLERRCLDAIDREKSAIGALRSVLSAQKEGIV